MQISASAEHCACIGNDGFVLRKITEHRAIQCPAVITMSVQCLIVLNLQASHAILRSTGCLHEDTYSKTQQLHTGEKEKKLYQHQIKIEMLTKLIKGKLSEEIIWFSLTLKHGSVFAIAILK